MPIAGSAHSHMQSHHTATLKFAVFRFAPIRLRSHRIVSVRSVPVKFESLRSALQLIDHDAIAKSSSDDIEFYPFGSVL